MAELSEDEKQPENENQGLVEIYTEVTPERAEQIIKGIHESSVTPQHFSKRWYAETILDLFEPSSLKEKGITRNQAIFASPIPYQGENPLYGRVLLVLDVSPQNLYVAEADYVSQIITPVFGSDSLQNIWVIQELLNFSDRDITRQEFEEKFNALSEEQKASLIAMSEAEAKAYWESVIPYDQYIQQGLQYEEPEILMPPQTQIFAAKRLT